ncbi:hypothetical protein H6P81_002297 [Aristolochia fimbriata]|uniref:Phospholipid/glycerol acyltransferase domain-containing protein n=1 Tax=Aristolochia fimbriata TaxID=158543 RepID=A0AAV7FB10_ARIFI|nr:hypothetical protein H6P81_002297 [Aristolochia fimbriata]
MAATGILKFLLFSRVILRRQKSSRSLQRRGSSLSYLLKRLTPPLSTEKLPQQTLVCDVEGALFKSPSLFPYFMLMAFEAGGLLRALLLFVLYPFLSFLASDEWAIRVMVMVTFCGIREESLTVGRTVLPKFFLEDVRLEGFEVLMRAGKKVAVTEMPRVMVEVFLKEYLNVDVVAGRELKVFGGYCTGLMEKKRSLDLEDEKLGRDVVGMTSFNIPRDRRYLFSKCKEIDWVTEADKRNSSSLPSERYPKPLIFHDGRLAFRPTPMASLAMFMWIPFAFFLALFRLFISLSLPYTLSFPILVFTGMKLRAQTQPIQAGKTRGAAKGTLYVCNHRTLLDPVYLSFSLRKSVTAVTYSLSRVSEMLSPIKTVSLTRNREQDRSKMESLLGKGDLVVCPEGTTCREPFLLRFSPLFAELTEEIVPVAMNARVSMFYGTTAGGLKCLDPLFFLMNPGPVYEVEVLQKMVVGEDGSEGARKSSIEVANMVQAKIGDSLGFECTRLTRKDKYLMLAGNEGIVHGSG